MPYDSTPEGWAVPTFREVSERVTMLGLPPEEAMMPILFGGGAAAFLVIVSTVVGSLACFGAAVLVAVTAIPGGMFMLRHLHKIDPDWFSHLTTHRWPAVRYLGK